MCSCYLLPTVVLGILGGRPLAVCAQHTARIAHPATADTARLRSAAAATIDTAVTLHRYFVERRHNGRLVLGASMLVADYAMAAPAGPGAQL